MDCEAMLGTESIVTRQYLLRVVAVSSCDIRRVVAGLMAPLVCHSSLSQELDKRMLTNITSAYKT